MADNVTPINTGGQKIRWPGTAEAVLDQMKIYLAHEQTLPPEKQLQDVSLTLLQSIGAEAQAAQEAVDYNRAERTKAAAVYRTVLNQAKEILRQARKVLEARYLEDVSPMVDWGFETKLSRGKPAILSPNAAHEWRTLLEKYVARESALPETERVTTPAYTEVSELLQTLQASLQKREEAQANRETAVAIRRAVVKRLRDLLKVAALVRIHVHYGGQISPELQLWGYDVAASQPARPETPPETPSS